MDYVYNIPVKDLIKPLNCDIEILTDKLYSYMSCVNDLYKINMMDMLSKMYIAENHPEIFEMLSQKLDALEEQDENNVDYKEEN